MSKLAGIFIVVVIAVIAGGAAFLATWDIPAPSARIEKVIPDEKLPH
ncbi:MAG: hypothetical protein HYU60_04390 [Magnetospirillum sp.]|nr:hypothetical protein [Magnetospirillum sp.]